MKNFFKWKIRAVRNKKEEVTEVVKAILLLFTLMFLLYLFIYIPSHYKDAPEYKKSKKVEYTGY